MDDPQPRVRSGATTRARPSARSNQSRNSPDEEVKDVEATADLVFGSLGAATGARSRSVSIDSDFSPDDDETGLLVTSTLESPLPKVQKPSFSREGPPTDKLKRAAMRCCTLFGLLTVLSLLVGALLWGQATPPDITSAYANILIKSCSLPVGARLRLNGTAGLGSRLLPWPRHVYTRPSEHAGPYVLSQQIDFHLLTDGVVLRTATVDFIGQRLSQHCEALVRSLGGPVINGTTIATAFTGHVAVTKLVMTISSAFGLETPSEEGLPWGTIGPFSSNTSVPQFPMHEGYQLNVDVKFGNPKPPKRTTARDLTSIEDSASGFAYACVTAATPWGILRGIDTFHQLVLEDGTIAGAPLRVDDEPRYPWRGVSLDTSRHFLPMKTMKRTISAMAASKYNVLHWHITDAQSFPISLRNLPLLAEKGAFDPTKQYSEGDVTSLIQYAASHGIRVMPEIDVPAHTASWGKAYPEILAPCHRTGGNFTDLHEMDKYALNPIEPRTFEILEEVFAEITRLFPDKYLHIGGDEFQPKCWEEVPAIVAYRQAHNLTLIDLFKEFVGKLQSMLHRIAPDKTLVTWQELYNGVGDDFVNKSMVVEVWRDWSGEPSISAELAARNGRAVLIAAHGYLDHEGDGWRVLEDNSFPAPSTTFPKDLSRQIWGGEAAMWEERATHVNIECRMWPRGSVLGEKMWSPASITTASARAYGLYTRLWSHGELLTSLGIGAYPMPQFHGAVRSHANNSFDGSARANQAAKDGYVVEVTPSLVNGFPSKSEYSQCFPVDQRSQPPVVQRMHRVLSWNIDDGGGRRLEDILTYIRDRDYDVVGLVELVGWIDDAHEARKTEYAFGSIARRAGAAGFPYAEMLTAPSTYHMGILSKWPITVLDRHTDGMERGFLVAETNGVAYVVMHMHAHNATQRNIESKLVLETLKRLLSPDKPTFIMGDFNTLSPHDDECYDDEGFVSYLFDSRVDTRFQLKYLIPRKAKSGGGFLHSIDFRAMQAYIDEGYIDLVRAAMNDTDCVYTEPTPIAHEQPAIDGYLPKLRLDYILGNEAVTHAFPDIHCRAVNNTLVSFLSDHLPVTCEWPLQGSDE